MASEVKAMLFEIITSFERREKQSLKIPKFDGDG